MKFTELPYKRPDLDAAMTQINDIRTRLTAATSFEQARAAFMELEALASHVYTLSSIAYNRYCVDTRDEFYNAEHDFWMMAQPQLSEPINAFTQVLLASPYRADFEKEFGTLMFLNAEIALKTFKPEIISDLQEENKLVSEYDKLIASAQIEFQGEKRTLAQMTPFKVSSDDAVRRAAWAAEGDWYASKSAELDTIFDKLVKVRVRIAKKLGYDSFQTLGYYRMGRNCYTADDVARYRAAVQKYLVPVAAQVKREQAERTDMQYPMSIADDGLTFRTGNAKPQGSADDILSHARIMYTEMSPETAEFINFMYENEMFDVLSKPGKAQGGHCSTLPEYGPFVFANFNGTQGDVEVMTHEMGHALAAYEARDIVPMENREYTYESAEVHSMAMEFFCWNWAEGFFGKDTAKFRYSHLADALTFIPYGTMVDHFQHIMYEQPDLTPAQRHEEWAKLEALYRPWMTRDGVPFYGEGRGWQRQLHIYKRPFYYIDYCLAQTVALQFWAVMQSDYKDAWNRYFNLVKQAGTKTFNGLVESAELDTPFGDEALRFVAQTAKDFLDAFDKESIK